MGSLGFVYIYDLSEAEKERHLLKNDKFKMNWFVS